MLHILWRKKKLMLLCLLSYFLSIFASSQDLPQLSEIKILPALHKLVN